MPDDAGDSLKVAKPKRLDELITSGWYYFRISLLLELSVFMQTAYMFYMQYSGATPKVNCAGVTMECKNFANCTATTSNYTFDYQFYSVNVDWGYECDEAVKKSISYHMLGVLVGSFMFGQFGETYGRKKALLAAKIVTAASFLLTPFAWNLLTLTIIRVIGGFFIGGQIVLALVMFIENSPKASRMWVSLMLSWSPNIMLYAGLAYWAHDWKTLSYAIAVIAIPGIIHLAFFVFESPRWLLQKGRIDEAKAVIHKIYKINGSDIDEETVNAVFENELAARKSKANKMYSLFDILKSKELIGPVLVLCMCFNFTALNAYGILFNIEKLSGSMYFNAALNGFLRYIFNIIFAIVEPRAAWLGRKAIHGICLMIVLAAVLLVIVANFMDVEWILTAKRYALIGAAAMTSQLFLVLGVIGNEILPTPVRTIGYSFLQVFNRLGVAMSPFLFMVNTIWEPLPLFIMLTLAALQLSVFTLAIPETRGKPMPEEMPGQHKAEDVELVEKIQE
ncbi:unnamed protein product, partial [Mesorhabditis spiculigera]